MTGDPLEQLAALVERQNELLRILVQPVAHETARRLLGGAEERKVFARTDGSRSSRQMETETGVSKSTVARWWRDWRSAGLVVESPKGYARAVLTLDELALPTAASKPKTPSRRDEPKGD